MPRMCFGGYENERNYISGAKPPKKQSPQTISLSSMPQQHKEAMFIFSFWGGFRLMMLLVLLFLCFLSLSLSCVCACIVSLLAG